MNFEPLLNYKKIMEELTLTTPTLLFSAVSLILLAYTNRFLSYAQLVRQLRDRYVENPSDITEAQIENLRKRLNLTRTMQGLGIASLFLCVVSMFLIYIGLQLFSAYVFGLALILLIAGVIPKFSSLLTTIPYCVLGGATVSVFASIAMTGMKLITSQNMTFRNTSIVGLAAALGMGISQASDSLASFPDWFVMIFGKSPVVVATLLAVLLNIVLPKDKEDAN